MRVSRAGFLFLEACATVALSAVVLGGSVVALAQVSDTERQVNSDYLLRSDGLGALDRMARELGCAGRIEIEEGPTSDACGLTFRLPRDADRDGWPDLDARGRPVFRDARIAYVLLPQPDGTTSLCRVNAGERPSVLATHVTRLSVERGRDSLRLRLEMVRRGDAGQDARFRSERLVRLKNAGAAR